MNILILGGDGFIGSNLRNKHLSLNDKVCVVDINTIRSIPQSNNYIFIQKDLSDLNINIVLNDIIKTFNPDFVYNCVAVATPSYYVKFPIETFKLDFEVNKILIDILHNTKVPFIHFSSSEVYGKTWSAPYKEDSDCVLGPANKPRWIYATSKLLLDQYIQASNMNCCILRPQNFCGYDLDWLPDIKNNLNNKWLPRLPACYINNLITHKPLYVVLPGSQQRCYCHISDAINGIISIINNWDKCSGEILNIGNKNNETSIIDIARLYIDIYTNLTKEDKVDIVYINGEEYYGKGYEDSIRRMFSDNKLVKLTGWKPKLSLKSTIQLIIKNSLEKYAVYIDKYREIINR